MGNHIGDSFLFVLESGFKGIMFLAILSIIIAVIGGVIGGFLVGYYFF